MKRNIIATRMIMEQPLLGVKIVERRIIELLHRVAHSVLHGLNNTRLNEIHEFRKIYPGEIKHLELVERESGAIRLLRRPPSAIGPEPLDLRPPLLVDDLCQSRVEDAVHLRVLDAPVDPLH